MEFNRLDEKDITELIPILGNRKKFLIKYNNYITENTVQLAEVDLNNDTSIEAILKDFGASINTGVESTSTNTGTESASTVTNTSDCETYNAESQGIPNIFML